MPKLLLIFVAIMGMITPNFSHAKCGHESVPCPIKETTDSLKKKSIKLREELKKCGYCLEHRLELEKFDEDVLLPALEKYGKEIVEKPDRKISEFIIEVAIENQNSAAEGFSYALGDAYISNPKDFLDRIKKIKSEKDRKLIINNTEFGILNHTDLPKEKMNRLIKELADGIR